MKDIRLNKISYGGYVIWEWIYTDYSICDVEKPGWDYAVATLDDVDSAKLWIDAHPNGDAVVADAKADKEKREHDYWRDYLIDVMCG